MMKQAPRRFVLSAAFALLLTQAEPQVYASVGEGVWCDINLPSVDKGRWKDVPSSSIHVVREEEQYRAKQALKGKETVRIIAKEAIEYLKPDETINKARRVYLVRAAALNISSQYTLPSKSLAVEVDENKGILKVTNYSLSAAGAIPTNFAIMVQVDVNIVGAHGLCLTAR